MRDFARFDATGTIQVREKHPWRNYTFSNKVAGWNLEL